MVHRYIASLENERSFHSSQCARSCMRTDVMCSALHSTMPYIHTYCTIHNVYKATRRDEQANHALLGRAQSSSSSSSSSFPSLFSNPKSACLVCTHMHAFMCSSGRVVQIGDGWQQQQQQKQQHWLWAVHVRVRMWMYV